MTPGVTFKIRLPKSTILVKILSNSKFIHGKTTSEKKFFNVDDKLR